MSVLERIRRFLSYLIGKRSELADLEYKDAVLARAVLKIHRTRTHKERATIPLFHARKVHRLDRENALASLRERIEALQAVRQELREAGTITCELLARHLPSVSWIKVVRAAPDLYLAYEGNGRLEALQQVFAPEDGIRIEVEEYHFRNPSKVLRILNRVRKLNGLREA